MIIVPYDSFICESNVHVDSIKNMILSYVGDDNSIFNPSCKLRYEGRFVENKFYIRRMITGRNSFIPSIKGVVEDSDKKTKVKITMRPHFVVVAFFIFILIVQMTSGFKESPVVTHDITEYGIIGIVYILFLIMYKDKKHLLNILRIKDD